MLGLFGTLNLGTRALQAQQTAVEVAGQNLANVNNSAYARQRVQMQTSATMQSSVGQQGTGVEITAIMQIRDALLDNQIQGELSVGGYWTAQQTALESAQAGLGEYINTSGTASSTDGATQGLADDLSGLFNAFQSVATTPDSLSERQLLVSSAQMLATRFNQTSARLDQVKTDLNTTLSGNVDSANSLISDIAKLNARITAAEGAGGGTANDLRDLRQQKLESLSQLVNFTQTTGNNGGVNISIDGNQIISDSTVVDTLQTYDAGGGQMLVRTTNGGTNLNLTGGSIQGTIDARDGALATVRSGLDTLASQLITQVNTIYSAGYDLNGNTGANFFTGTNASDISVNSDLLNDPSLVQAAGVSGASGDNSVALALAQLASQPQSALGNQTFNAAYNKTVAGLGYALNDANTQSSDSSAVQAMLSQRRDSVSGVSIDEEMSDLIRFQKAYVASAKIVTTVDEMLDTVLNMKR